MDIKDLDKKTAVAVLDEVIKIIGECKPAIGEEDHITWFIAYTNVREMCYRLKQEIENV